MNLSQSLQFAKEKLNSINSPIRIISHLDTDGLTSASILIKTLTKENFKFSLSIIKQLSPEILSQLSREDYEAYFFLDLGSGNLDIIKTQLKNKKIFILDHHLPQKIENDFIHINPHLFNIDGSKEISGAGLAYLFSKTINLENKNLAHLAIIGAIADIQEDKGFLSLNHLILEDAIEAQKIEVKTGLRMFGTQTRPLYKILQYSTDPYIPGITGNESSAISFLEELKIDKEKKLIHLSKEELKNLVTAIILRRLGSESNPEDVLGPIYLLREEKEESPTKDCREFATLLNACGRLDKSSAGIGACLNDNNLKIEAINLLDDYKREIINSLNWFYANKETKVIEKNNLVIINAENNIRDTMIGTITSMLSKSNIYPKNTLILSLAHTPDNNTKLSIRISGNNYNINLKELLNKITEKLGYKAGGHETAAGAIIPQEKELELIKILTTESFIKSI